MNGPEHFPFSYNGGDAMSINKLPDLTAEAERNIKATTNPDLRAVVERLGRSMKAKKILRPATLPAAPVQDIQQPEASRVTLTPKGTPAAHISTSADLIKHLKHKPEVTLKDRAAGEVEKDLFSDL